MIREGVYLVPMYARGVKDLHRFMFPGRVHRFIERFGGDVLCVVKVMVFGVSFLRDGFLRFQFFD